MKKRRSAALLPWLILGLGILGALLRALLYATGVDDRGLLVDFHIYHILLGVLTVLTGACLVFLTRNLKQAGKYGFNFPKSVISAVGSAAAAVGFAVSSLQMLINEGEGLATASALLGLISAGILAVLAFARLQGKQPSSVLSMVICVFLMVRLVYCYRLWSADPQLQDYIFALLANTGAMLACYFNAAFATDEGNRRLHTLLHLAAVYCAVVCLPFSDDVIFYAAVAVWMFTDLCDLTPMPRTFEKVE